MSELRCVHGLQQRQCSTCTPSDVPLVAKVTPSLGLQTGVEEVRRLREENAKLRAALEATNIRHWPGREPCWCGAMQPENHHAYCAEMRGTYRKAREAGDA